MSETLPSPRAFLTSLFSELSAQRPANPVAGSHTAEPANPLTSASPATKALFLTLHSIFPTELLPALDLLDRGLVSRFSAASKNDGDAQGSSGEEVKGGQSSDVNVYYVCSSHSSPKSGASGGGGSSASKSRGSGPTISPASNTYEVRLTPWNCSCPAFTFSAFPPSPPPTRSRQNPSSIHPSFFGGRLLDQDSVPPICKHLLACAIAERCPALFGEYVEEVVASVEEIAGRGAGW